MTVAELNQHLEAERRLAGELAQYAGEWVAVLDHHVVAHADTYEALLVEIEGKDDVDGIFRVPEDQAAACYY